MPVLRGPVIERIHGAAFCLQVIENGAFCCHENKAYWRTFHVHLQVGGVWRQD
jgi:hypothetical protein